MTFVMQVFNPVVQCYHPAGSQFVSHNYIGCAAILIVFYNWGYRYHNIQNMSEVDVM